jgi:hypothetical protein
MRGWQDLPAGLRKALWFAGLYGAGILTVSAVAYGIRAMIL